MIQKKYDSNETFYMQVRIFPKEMIRFKWMTMFVIYKIFRSNAYHEIVNHGKKFKMNQVKYIFEIFQRFETWL